MSKRKKVQISEENKDFSVSKAKKSFRRKTQVVGESDLENPVQTFHSNSSPSKATKTGRMKKYKGNSLENTEILIPALETSSSAEEGGCASFDKKELGHNKVFLPPSQGGKFKPVFTKSKKPLAERHERDDEKDSAVWVEQPPLQDVLESSVAQCVVRNVLETVERPFQNTMSPSESLRLMDLLLPKGEDAGDQLMLPCEEKSGRLDVKMQDQERIRSINRDDVFQQKMGIANNLHANICEKEMPERQISFVLQTSDNEDAEGLKMRELPSGSLMKEMSISVLAEGKINDHLKSSQYEEEHLSSSNTGKGKSEAIQDIIKSGSVEEANWAKNGSREDAGFVDLMASQTRNESNITQPLFLMDLSVLVPEKQSSNLHISCVAGVGSSSDGKGIDQDTLYQSGKTEEQSDICNSTDVLKAGGALNSSTISEYTTDHQGLWTSDKPGKQSSSLRSEVIAAEQNNYEGQGTSSKDFQDTWSMCMDLEKEVGISEPKYVQVIETTSQFCPQPDGDVHSETKKTSVQAVLYSEKRGPGMTAEPANNIATSQEEEIPILFKPQQQWKESECEKLMPNNKQLELDECGLRPNEIKETLFNADITHQNLTKIPKAETKPKIENSTDVHVDGKEVVICEENKSQPIDVDICLPSTNTLSQLERETGPPTTNRAINADSETQQPLLASYTGFSICASRDSDSVTQTHPLCKDPLNLEYLSPSQLQGISESHNPEFPLDKLFSLENQHTHSKDKRDQCAAGGSNRIEPPTPVVHAGLCHPNNAKVEVTERVSDPSEQEDATDVVCGLIKELSNLNRLIMSKHRDLDSFKRLKFRRNRQSGKSVLHSMNNMTSTLCTMKKKDMTCSQERHCLL